MTKVRVYVPLGVESGELAHPINPDGFEDVVLHVNGVERASAWRVPKFRLISRDQGVNLVPVDMPWLGSHALLLKHRAMDALGPSLSPFGELLPVPCSTKLWLFNPTRVIDALDQDASKVVRFSSGRLMHVDSYAFRLPCVATASVFKIPDFRASPTFFSQEMVQTIQDLGITGLDFNLVWESLDV